MENQSKLLSKEYLEIRLKEFKEIEKNEITFSFENSNRAFSNSLYICFYSESGGKFWKRNTLRISDHFQNGCPHTQFLIEPNRVLSKKIKLKFMRTLNNIIKKCKIKHIYKEFTNLNKNEKDKSD